MRISDWSSDVCSSDLERQGQRGLSDPRSADEKRVGSPLQATAEQFVDLGIAARRKLSLEFGVMLGSDEARENPEPAFGDAEVMIAAAKLDAPHLDHADAAALGAQVYGELFKVDHAVGDRVQLKVGLRRVEIIEGEDRKGVVWGKKGE